MHCILLLQYTNTPSAGEAVKEKVSIGPLAAVSVLLVLVCLVALVLLVLLIMVAM